ncbi:MAG TPA: hypothetical protein VLA19_13280 [Herpetosiphonaceae bacterium]|nr:hypothetical protein [Herpetosiphonaceae bacterium]
MKGTHVLVRWSGLAWLVAGALFPAYTLLHPAEEGAAAVLSSPWAAIHSLWFMGTLLTLAGLVGMYAWQAGTLGRLGAAGFVLAFTGTALMLGVIFYDSYIVPVLAASAPALLDPDGSLATAPALLAGGSLGFVLDALGYLLFGIATIRAGTLPRAAGLLLAAGGALFPAGQALGPLIGTACALVFAVGLIWSGYVLWSGSSAPVRRPQPAIG